MYRSKWLKMQTAMLSVQNCKFETSFFYLCDLIPPFQRSSQNKSCTYEPFCRTVSFKNPFYLHCVKSVQIRSYFWSVFSCIRPGNNSVFGHFSCSECKILSLAIHDKIFNFGTLLKIHCQKRSGAEHFSLKMGDQRGLHSYLRGKVFVTTFKWLHPHFFR